MQNKKKKILWMGEFSQLSTGFSTYARYILPYLYNTGKYEIAEFASYVSNFDPNNPYEPNPFLETVPWKVYGNEPDPKNQEEIKQFNANKINQFGLWKFDEVILDFQPDIVCVPPGTLTMTERGYVPIETIKIGEKVLTHTGKMQRVLKTMRRSHNGNIIKIEANGVPHDLNLTPEHPVLVFKYKKQTNKNKNIQKIYENEIPVFVEAKNIKPKDLLVINPTFDYIPNQTLKMSDYLINYIEIDTNNIQANINGKPIINNIKIDEYLAKLIGYIIADGHWSNGSGLSVIFGSNELQFAEEVQLLVKNIFNLDGKITKCTDKNAYIYNCNNVLLSEFLENWIGEKYDKKHIPIEFFHSDNKIKLELISGLIRGDENYAFNTIKFNTVNTRLAYEYRLLLLSCGIRCTYNRSINANTNTGYMCAVESHGIDADNLHQFVNKKDKILGTNSTFSKKSYWTHKINQYFAYSVSKVRKEKYRGLVYNLEVEHDNSYTLNSCVHNCSIRDPWMDLEWINKTPYRKHFKFIHMATCDGEPQKQEWIDLYKTCDKFLTYSYWAKRLLEEQTNNTLKVSAVASPGVDTKEFKPLNKQDIRKKFGLKEDSFIVMTVMRNQPRKLYPELFRAFSKYLDLCRKNGKHELAAKSYLYCHTSYPDVGWDLSLELLRLKISHKVLFTLMCDKCNVVYPSFYPSELSVCRRCQNLSARFPNTASGVDRSVLAKIMNIPDLYIQYSCSEGWAMPVNDAKGCGIPCMCVDYSAMIDHNYNGGGIPIKVERFCQEPLNATNQLRAWPDNDDCAKKIYEFATNPELQQRLSNEARKCAIDYYDWENIAKIWDNILDNTDCPNQLQTWYGPPRIIKPQTSIPNNLNNHQFIEWCIKYILQETYLLNSSMMEKWISILNVGYEVIPNERNESIKHPVNREKLIQYMLSAVQQKNMLEQYRYEKLVLKKDKNNNMGMQYIEL